MNCSNDESDTKAYDYDIKEIERRFEGTSMNDEIDHSKANNFGNDKLSSSKPCDIQHDAKMKSQTEMSLNDVSSQWESSNIIQEVKELAQDITSQLGYVFMEEIGMYYDHSTGYYYDDVSKYYLFI